MMRPRLHPSSRSWSRGLTLLELLLSMALLSVVMIIIASAVGTMQNTWVRMREKSDQFRGTRMALDRMSRHLQQATLAPRLVPDLEDESATTNAPAFKRESDLHFVCGPARDLLQGAGVCGDAVFFQGPFAEPSNEPAASFGNAAPMEHDLLDETLSAWGYFVEFSDDDRERPSFLRAERDRHPPRMRFRLLEFRQPTEEMQLLQLDPNKHPNEPKLAGYTSPNELYRWFREPLASGNSRDRHVSVVAENILAAIITPFDPSAENEADTYAIATKDGYDSRRAQNARNPSPLDKAQQHKLPPALRLTVVAMSEDSWSRLTDGEVNSVGQQLRSTVDGLFRDPRPENFRNDLDRLEGALNRQKIAYRIFTIKLRMPEQ